MSDLDDIDEGEISDLSDGELNAVVAEWLVDEPGPMTYDPPDYCNDDAAFGRLVQRMPTHTAFLADEVVCNRDIGKSRVVSYRHDGNARRALSQCAARLALRGVDPREPTNA